MTLRKFCHSLLAVLAGNASYFSLERYLPEKARHAAFQVDWGLALDFWFCLVFWGLLARVSWFRK
jgi:hypothetical protein